jgi:hypothetical protein
VKQLVPLLDFRNWMDSSRTGSWKRNHWLLEHERCQKDFLDMILCVSLCSCLFSFKLLVTTRDSRLSTDARSTFNCAQLSIDSIATGFPWVSSRHFRTFGWFGCGYTESLSCQQEFEHYDEDMQWLEESVEQAGDGAAAPGESMVSTWSQSMN